MKIRTAIFSGSSTRVEQKPARKLPEFAFIGRSNVGKSSLINALTGNSKLAKTSQTPGKTQLVNHFLINDNWYLVDLPGYGYARLPDKERAKLRHIIWDYVNRSEELVMLFLDALNGFIQWPSAVKILEQFFVTNSIQSIYISIFI